MKSLLFILSLTIFSGIAFAQTPQAKCPDISVDSPYQLPGIGVAVTFIASLKNAEHVKSPKFHWAVTSGRILRGQGTRTIAVSFTKRVTAITATVTVKGLPEGCTNNASASTDTWESVPITLCDEYERLSFAEEEKRLKDLIPKLLKDSAPTSQIFLHLSITQKDTLRDAMAHARRIALFLESEIGDRIRDVHFQIEKGDEYITKIWLVPLDADPPGCAKRCKRVDAKNLI